jgi:hypothetical protein
MKKSKVLEINIRDIPMYICDTSGIRKAELCNRTSLLMLLYHTCIVQYYLSTTAQNEKMFIYRSENRPPLISNNQEFNIVGKNSQQLPSSGVYLTNCKNCVVII